MTAEQLVRNISVMVNGEIDFFLGAGASVGSGIPSGGDLVWFFKRMIYCNENRVSPEKYKDLYLQSTRDLLQDYFDKKGTYPSIYAAKEYSHYFEECFPLPIARQRFIDSQVSGRNPSLGYLCLADIIFKNKIHNVWTTNFDSMTETALSIIDPLKDCLICSSANASNISNLNPNKPCVCKLHGDFRYDTLQNTSKELQTLETEIYNYWLKDSQDKGIVIVGYSGNDDSVMTFLETHIQDKDFLSRGLFWTKIKNGSVSPRVIALMEKAKSYGKIAEIIEIEGFDTFLYDVYKGCDGNNTLIEEQWKTSIKSKKPLNFSQNREVSSFIKLNAFAANKYPKCKVFNTDVTSWKQLRSINENRTISALYNGRIYSFNCNDELKAVFGDHIKSSITEEEIDDRILRRHDSIYIGMLYELIEHHLNNIGLLCYGKNRYYDSSKYNIDGAFRVYEALEVSIECVSNKLYLCLLPTVHISNNTGKEISRKDYQFQVNKNVSKIYNKEYNEKLYKWQGLFLVRGFLTFKYKDTTVEFSAPAVSSGGNNRNTSWPELPSYEFEEPVMCYSNDEDKCAINQLKGLVRFGPIDASYIKDTSVRKPIKLAVLSPKECLNKILEHLNGLNIASAPKKDDFLPDYSGFSSIYKRNLIVPIESNTDLCKTYPIHHFNSQPTVGFVEFIKRGIDFFSLKVFEFDILIIYIPRSFARFRESIEISPDFNLHDAIKLYATEKGVAVQFIEERSIGTYDPCKVMWGLSTSLYAKSQGVLWQPKAISENTVYIGIGYAQSEKKGICIGCSQLFDSTGTGVRMILRKIDNPLYAGKRNPYMGKEEARKMMTMLREKYYHCCPTSKITRVVIHKTTPFMKDEIIGITQAFEGIDVDLIQIQEFTSWRGIRFGNVAQKEAYNYAMKRGIAIPLSEKSFLLWTHGCVMNDELSGINRNYYKNSRGIPSPLLIKKHYGEANGDTIAQEILMLSKMNWNSGDSLYKVLPVTLDFAKILSRMSKQDEAIYDKAYDFRYFM